MINTLAIVGAFLTGSIPFGFLIGRLLYSTDLRKSGSGNIGAMNALRTLGAPGAVAVLLLDIAKGVLPTLIATHIENAPWLAPACATAAVVGHCYSPWLGWRGGKGVATSVGAMFVLSWPAGLICVAAWVIGTLPTSFSSVGSILSSLVAPFALYAMTWSLWDTMFGIFIATIIPFAHRENIVRLRHGTESGISFLQRKSRA